MPKKIISTMDKSKKACGHAIVSCRAPETKLVEGLWVSLKHLVTSGCSSGSAAAAVFLMQYPRLFCLASTFLLYARSSVTCGGGLISRPTGSPLNGLQSHISDVLSEQAVDTETELNLGLENEGPDVLLVLDPNGVICWEDVQLDAFTNATLLHWLHQQHDVLTMSDRDRTGAPVQVTLKRITGHCSRRSGFMLLLQN